MRSGAVAGTWRGLRLAGSAFTGLLFPESCQCCGSSDDISGGLCSRCNVRLLSLVVLPYCTRCGSTLPPNISQRTDGCGDCPSTLPRFEVTHRLGPYSDPLRTVVRDVKYRGRTGMLRRATVLLGGRVAAAAGEYPPEVVTWVPSHWRRRLLRGTDHAQVIAERLAGELSLGLEGLLRRVRNTPPQVRLSRTARIENVRGAFEPTCALAGETVLLVDDVTTTGATANEAARQILDAGAGHVQLAVLAKSEPGEAWRAHIEPPGPDTVDGQQPA